MEMQITSGDGSPLNISKHRIRSVPYLLLDMVLSLPDEYSVVEPGKTVLAEVSLFNMGLSERVDAVLIFVVINPSGEIIVEKQETAAVFTSLSKVIRINVPADSEEGAYTLSAQANYNGKEAVSSLHFTVRKLSAQQDGADEKRVALLLAMWVLTLSLLLLAFLIIVFYINRFKKRKRDKPAFFKKYK